MNSSTFSTRLSELINERGISQKKLADSLNITRQSISLYINNQRTPDINVIINLCKFFNVSSDYLLGLSDVKSFDISSKIINEKLGLTEDSIKTIEKIKQISQEKNSLDSDVFLMDVLNQLLSSNDYFYFLLSDLCSYLYWYFTEIIYKDDCFYKYCKINNIDYDSLVDKYHSKNNKDYKLGAKIHDIQSEFKFLYNSKIKNVNIDVDYHLYKLIKKTIELYNDLADDNYYYFIDHPTVKENVDFFNSIMTEETLKEIIDKYNNLKNNISQK